MSVATENASPSSCTGSKTPAANSVRRSDTGVFQCTECESIFKRRDHLGRHVMTQHSDNTTPRTKCPFKDCDTEMVRRDHLRRHISQVHKVDPSDVLPYSRRKPFNSASVDPLKRFKCVYDGCDAELSRKDHLCRHIKNIHKADPRQVIGHLYKQPKAGEEGQSSQGTPQTSNNVGATPTAAPKKKKAKKKRKEPEIRDEIGLLGGTSLADGGCAPLHSTATGGQPPHPSTISDYDYALSYCQLFLK